MPLLVREGRLPVLRVEVVVEATEDAVGVDAEAIGYAGMSIGTMTLKLRLSIASS